MILETRRISMRYSLHVYRQILRLKILNMSKGVKYRPFIHICTYTRKATKGESRPYASLHTVSCYTAFIVSRSNTHVIPGHFHLTGNLKRETSPRRQKRRPTGKGWGFFDLHGLPSLPFHGDLINEECIPLFLCCSNILMLGKRWLKPLCKESVD